MGMVGGVSGGGCSPASLASLVQEVMNAAPGVARTAGELELAMAMVTRAKLLEEQSLTIDWDVVQAEVAATVPDASPQTVASASQRGSCTKASKSIRTVALEAGENQPKPRLFFAVLPSELGQRGPKSFELYTGDAPEVVSDSVERLPHNSEACSQERLRAEFFELCCEYFLKHSFAR